MRDSSGEMCSRLFAVSASDCTLAIMFVTLKNHERMILVVKEVVKGG
jgi:hypothetical protein